MSASSFLRRLIGRREGVNGEVQKLFKLCDALMAESGEYASTALASEALEAYEALHPRDREQFFEMLARDYSPSPEAVASDRAEFRALLLCLAGLADGPRNAIMAAYLDGATGEEIARKIGAPVGTVKSWIHRGLAALRECLGR